MKLHTFIQKYFIKSICNHLIQFKSNHVNYFNNRCFKCDLLASYDIHGININHIKSVIMSLQSISDKSVFLECFKYLLKHLYTLINLVHIALYNLMYYRIDRFNSPTYAITLYNSIFKHKYLLCHPCLNIKGKTGYYMQFTIKILKFIL